MEKVRQTKLLFSLSECDANPIGATRYPVVCIFYWKSDFSEIKERKQTREHGHPRFRTRMLTLSSWLLRNNTEVHSYWQWTHNVLVDFVATMDSYYMIPMDSYWYFCFDSLNATYLVIYNKGGASLHFSHNRREPLAPYIHTYTSSFCRSKVT